MVERDYVKELAKAIAENRPIQDLGRSLLAEIQRERNHLSQQVNAIQNLLTLYPEKLAPTKASAPPPTPDLTTPAVSDGKGLPEGQKIKLMELATAMWRERGLKAEIDPGELLKLWAEQGEQLEVSQPRAVAGSFLFRARQRLEKANGNGGLQEVLEAAAAPSASVARADDRPTYKEAVLRVVAARPKKAWRLTDIRDVAEKRGWIAPSNQNPLETLRVAANDLVKRGDRLRKAGPGLYVYVDEAGIRFTLKPREVRSP